MIVNEVRAYRAKGADCEYMELDSLVPYRKRRSSGEAMEASLAMLDNCRGL